MATEATDYTPLQERGRRVYLREGCWYCHSQFVRPVTGETRRWGPVSEAGEYTFDVPHLFGTRRIGPDLTRVGLKYGDEWHYAHFWNPRMLTPESIMAPFEGLFDAPEQRIKIVDDWGRQSNPREDAVHPIAVQFRQQGADEADAKHGRAAVRPDGGARQVARSSGRRTRNIPATRSGSPPKPTISSP